MKESTVVNGWKAEARREDILLLMELGFPGLVNAESLAAVGAQADLKELSRWLAAVAIAGSPAEFRARSGIGWEK